MMLLALLFHAVWFLLALFLILPAIAILPYWKIFSRAGFSGWLSLLMLVPVANLVILYIVAFSEWKTGSSQRYRAAFEDPSSFRI
jgi:uncharacterized membrane protein YhaH (DUF805 family)